MYIGGYDAPSLVLDPRARELRTASGIIPLQRQSFEVLRVLAERAGEVVERAELQRALWPNGTFVDFEHSLNAAVRRLRVSLGDDAVRPRYIETVPGVGYRLRSPHARRASKRPPERTDSRPRLAVLPFLSIGGTSAFADGLTEEVTVQVNRALGASVAVLARSSSVVFKDVRWRVADIAEDLRADYLVEGLIRTQPDKIRVTASLVEASAETHEWNGVVEVPAGEVLSTQAAIASALIDSLERAFADRCGCFARRCG